MVKGIWENEKKRLDGDGLQFIPGWNQRWEYYVGISNMGI
jgi:hypothetical protein